MPPIRPYVCVCITRQFNSQRALTCHENVCSVVAEQDKLRYRPYRRESCHKPQEPSCLTVTGDDLTEGGDNINSIQYGKQNSSVPVSQCRNIPHPSTTGSIQPVTSQTRPTTRSHTRRILEGYRDAFDILPEAPPLAEPQDTGLILSKKSHARVRMHFTPFETPVDSFGRFRKYVSKPLTMPDGAACARDFTDADISPDTIKTPNNSSIAKLIAPCPNLTTFYLLQWFWDGSNKTITGRDNLRNILLRPDFNPSDLAGIDLRAVDKKLATAPYSPEAGGAFEESEGWREVAIPIQVPARQRGQSGDSRKGHRISVPGLHSRKILDGVRKAFSHNNQTHFHYEPFESCWVPPGASRSQAQTLMGEIYNSPEMIEAHKSVQRLKISDENCKLPRVVAAIMLGSDAMQLGAFSTKKAWMLYLWLGNLSKYERCKPSSNSCFDLAHIPSLPDSVKDEITKLNGRPPSENLLTHLRRELMHSVLHELLDSKFLQAWQHGIVIKCADGIVRRVFPRIFTYSADYPERVLIAAIRNKGMCPCPRCLIPLNRVHNMGTKRDMQLRRDAPRRDSAQRRKLVTQARHIIYDQQKAIDNNEVEALLRPTSLVPTENAFSKRLSPFGFDFHKMFVVDLLHEIELGVWKSLLTHLIRIIHGCGSNTVAEFNQRFRAVPTFSNSTIRKFSDDVASLKRLAARDLEDILQCCIPVFKGLLPDSIDSEVQRLLFTLAYWHGLAKLRQHTSVTLEKLSRVTTRLGNELRAFQAITDDMEVFETPREVAARQRKVAVRTQRKPATSQPSPVSTRRQCKLNLNTPKFHAIGHYVAIIARYGTTDSFSTQTTELQHRKIKAQWFRTNMREAIVQMTRIGDIGDALRKIQKQLDKLDKQNLSNRDQSDLLDGSDSTQPYGIGQSDRAEDAVNIPQWVQHHNREPCIKFFIRSLKEHILSRITGDCESSELGKVSFLNDRMYSHATLRINYTSYDVRRQHDILNPKSSCRHILLPNDRSENPSAHPFLYAKILGIYHAKVKYWNRPPRRMDFLWVRWFNYDDEKPGNWDLGSLDRLHYGTCRNDAELSDAFGFVDPQQVIRACHLIPDFNAGRVKSLGSLASDTDQGDWSYHVINRFVDRDMLMRYLGGGVGHFNQCVLTEPEPSTYEMEDEIECIEMEENEFEPEDDVTQVTQVNRTNGCQDDDGDSDDGSEVQAETDEEDFVEDLYDP